MGFENFVAINFWCSFCVHVKLNTGSFLFVVFFNKWTECNLITSAKIVSGLRIVVKVIITFRYNDVMYCISASFIKIIVCLCCLIDLSNLIELHPFMSWFNPVIYVFICVIYFGHAQIFTNEYFDSNSFFAKRHNFVVSLLFIMDDQMIVIWSPMAYLFSW